MDVRRWQVAALVSSLIGVAACSRSTGAPGTPTIALIGGENGSSPRIVVSGLQASVLQALETNDRSPAEWSSVLRVAVDAEAPAMLGEYAVTGRALSFTPLFPFDQGRKYHIRLDLSRVPGQKPGAAVLETVVGRPASAAVPSTAVARVYPSGDRVPENLLRMYVEFSAPMGRKSGVEYISVRDSRGNEIPGAVLPLDYEFWSPDHRRFTIFLDPGRVKKGILPNQQMGRPLEIGRSVTLVISREWRDEHGLPLKEEFSRTFRVGPADEEPLDTSAWRIAAPQAGGRAPAVVTFPEPLDHGLLMRAVGVTRGGQQVSGDIVVGEAETQWSFTPAEPWRPGVYQLLALDILEDLAGNQIGRAFEVDNFDRVDKSPNPKTLTIDFTVK